MVMDLFMIFLTLSSSLPRACRQNITSRQSGGNSKMINNHFIFSGQYQQLKKFGGEINKKSSTAGSVLCVDCYLTALCGYEKREVEPSEE